ncbi:MAG: hypothetical protein EOM20_07305 [Spartobacteria bacterium]|nr:hypothetical protein [Spartobacteria bacterium]
MRGSPSAHVLLVFVDGLGLGAPDPAWNPLYRGHCPTLVNLLEQAKPIDPCMGVPGVPQSATGQTALLTGINAPRRIGRHVEGFPGPALRDIIVQHNIFKQLQADGYSCAFANAYFMRGWTEAHRRKYQSVTTVCTLSALGGVRDVDEMLDGRAVYQDLTRQSLQSRGYDGPLTTPADSARDLYRITREHPFTLFEYFQTDRCGHKANPEQTAQVLGQLDEFLATLLPLLDQRESLFLLTSDHGNIEDLRTPQHTMNPVPFIALGRGAENMQSRVTSLTHIVPALCAWFADSNVGG